VPHYELMFIVRPDAEKEVVDASIDRLENLIRQEDGTILDCEILGRKRLAYEVKKFHEGIYVKMNFQSPPTSVSGLKAHMQLSEDIIRYLVIRTAAFIPTDEPAETGGLQDAEPAAPPVDIVGDTTDAATEDDLDAAVVESGSDVAEEEGRREADPAEDD